MPTRFKLHFLVKSKKKLQKLLPKWVFYVYSLTHKRAWLRKKLFTVFYDVDKFKRKRIRVARYPTKPWMRGSEYLKFKKRYQVVLAADTKRFSRVINKSLNAANMFVKTTELRNSPVMVLKPLDYFSGLLAC